MKLESIWFIRKPIQIKQWESITILVVVSESTKWKQL